MTLSATPLTVSAWTGRRSWPLSSAGQMRRAAPSRSTRSSDTRSSMIYRCAISFPSRMPWVSTLSSPRALTARLPSAHGSPLRSMCLIPKLWPIELKVDGLTMQSSSTDKMIFGVRELVAHYARVLTLEPGDLIATGTPAGVGAARRPPRYLRAGERIAGEHRGARCTADRHLGTKRGPGQVRGTGEWPGLTRRTPCSKPASTELSRSRFSNDGLIDLRGPMAAPLRGPWRSVVARGA